MIGSFLWTWIYFQTKNTFYTLFERNATRKNAADSLLKSVHKRWITGSLALSTHLIHQLQTVLPKDVITANDLLYIMCF